MVLEHGGIRNQNGQKRLCKNDHMTSYYARLCASEQLTTAVSPSMKGSRNAGKKRPLGYEDMRAQPLSRLITGLHRQRWELEAKWTRGMRKRNLGREPSAAAN